MWLSLAWMLLMKPPGRHSPSSAWRSDFMPMVTSSSATVP
ncbi:Uncharacterised protein [Mycobacterium tuberculosis]|nr:Uncharacterised protein [Mycobacterium tuberculosis]